MTERRHVTPIHQPGLDSRALDSGVEKSVPRLAYRILTVPGLHGSGEGHWQTLWERAHPDYRRVLQRDWNQPGLDDWSDAIEREVQSDALPALLVAHSFGCLAAVRCGALLGRARIVGALLVAPAHPALFGIESSALKTTLDFPSVLVASSSDPWLDIAYAQELARNWGSRFQNLGDWGHINSDSGLGAWPAGKRLLYELQRLIAGTNGPVSRRDLNQGVVFTV